MCTLDFILKSQIDIIAYSRLVKHRGCVNCAKTCSLLDFDLVVQKTIVSLNFVMLFLARNLLFFSCNTSAMLLKASSEH